MADQRILYTEEMVGSGHPSKADTLNRLALIEHNTDGTQKGFAVSGTNTYTATIGITAYTDKQAFDLVFANASTAASTLNIDAVGAKKLYIEVNGVYTQVGSGDIFAGMHTSITYDSSLDGAVGGFIVRNKRDPSGTYTPTLFNVTNIAASAAFVSQYLRVGNTVTVSGMIRISVATGGLQTQLDFSLPIASNFTAVNQAAGVAIANDDTKASLIRGDIANDRVSMFWINGAAGPNLDYYFHFTYLIV